MVLLEERCELIFNLGEARLNNGIRVVRWTLFHVITMVLSAEEADDASCSSVVAMCAVGGQADWF